MSEIGLGCWPLGGLQMISGQGISYGSVSEEDAVKIIHRALELGINTFDTADSYSLGGSETRLGKGLTDKRKSVYIFTKAGYIPFAPSLFEIDISYHHLVASLRRSLNHLNTDYVDLFQVHQIPRSEDDYKEIEKTFSELNATGEAKFCGVSIAKEIDVGLELIKRGFVDSLQMYFSLIDFIPSLELFDKAHEADIGIITAVPLAQGFLSGKFTSNFEFDATDTRNRLNKDEINKRIERTNQLKFLETNERTLSQAALAYVLSFDQVSTCIPGTKNLEQLQQNVDSTNIKLSEDEITKIKETQKHWI